MASTNPSILPSLQGAFPFRIGSTSYVLPDDLLPNVRFLGPLIDDVELLLFESDEMSNLPDEAQIGRLREMKDRQSLSYTVHLPLDANLGSSDESERVRSVAKYKRVVEITSSLAPFSYIVHFHGEQRGGVPARNLAKWIEALERSVEELLQTGVPPHLFAVETLDYPFSLVEGIVERHGLSICLDVGHLLFHGYSVTEHIDAYLPLTRVIHLHGNENGKDHRDISHFGSDLLHYLNNRLCETSRKERVLTMEVFGWTDFEASVNVMQGFAR